MPKGYKSAKSDSTSTTTKLQTVRLETRPLLLSLAARSKAMLEDANAMFAIARAAEHETGWQLLIDSSSGNPDDIKEANDLKSIIDTVASSIMSATNSIYASIAEFDEVYHKAAEKRGESA